MPPDETMSGNPEEFFCVPDYEGVDVLCERARWEEKIVRNRPELDGREDEVIEAIQNPELVLQDRDYPNRKHHIRRAPEGLYLKVVAGYRYDAASGTVLGHFVTAFLQDRLRDGDTLLYIAARR